MPFTAVRLKPVSGAKQIKSADEGYSFMMHMRLSSLNRPHLQAAKQAISFAVASEDCETRAWRTFRAAANLATELAS